MNKNTIRPRNENGKKHGYWKRYSDDGLVWYEGNYNNGKEDGLWLWYDDAEVVWEKEYFI